MSTRVNPLRVFALSGSLRAASINSALLRVVAQLAPPDIAVTVYADMGTLPLFNPDEENTPPDAVTRFRTQVAQADALLIASPEYAHGLTGSIKNALDWLVSFEPFAHKPVAVLNASPRAHHADAALREVLTTMAAVIVEPASISLPLVGAGLDEEGMLATPALVASLRNALVALRSSVTATQPTPALTALVP
jgi:chromate reductase, NAD(P)H dehydrogenase (quinone)